LPIFEIRFDLQTSVCFFRIRNGIDCHAIDMHTPEDRNDENAEFRHGDRPPEGETVRHRDRDRAAQLHHGDHGDQKRHDELAEKAVPEVHKVGSSFLFLSHAEHALEGAQKRRAVEPEHHRKPDDLHRRPARQLQHHEHDLHHEDDAVFDDAERIELEGDETAHVRRADEEHYEIACAGRDRRALNAERTGDEDEVQNDVLSKYQKFDIWPTVIYSIIQFLWE